MDSLFQLAELQNIAVEYRQMPHNISASAEYCGHYFIGMDYSLLYNPVQEQVHLAHEIGHCITGSFYNPYSKLDVRAKHEYMANKWAYQQLLPYDQLMRVVESGLTEVWQIAERFGLPDEFTAKAVDYYQSHNQMTA